MSNNEIKKNWLNTTDLAIRKIQKTKQPYNIEILNRSITVLPEVFSPKYFSDAEYFAEKMPSLVNSKSFLEIGVGTGIVSLFVALNGSSRVVGTDINPAAVKNTQINFENEDLEVELFVSDVFDSVPEDYKFDYIFWNHPFNKVDRSITDLLSRSVFDTDFECLERFFRDAHKHLNRDGTLILGTGDLADQDEVLEIAKKYSWRETRMNKRSSKHRVSNAEAMNLYIREFRTS